jgi:hypothetical protein
MQSHGTLDEDTYKDTSGTLKDRIVGEVLNFYSMHGRIPKISEYSRAVRSKLNSLDFDERSKLHRQANVQALKLAGKQGNLSKLGMDEDVTEDADAYNEPAEPDLQVIVGNALDAAIRSIQKELGNKPGDVAAHFFDSEAGETIWEILKDYAEQEIAMSDDLAEGVEDDEEELDEGKWNYPAEYTKKANADDEDELKVSLINKDARKAWRKKEKAKAHKELMTGKKKVATENFGGGMRDRPGSDDKSFDLAECKAFLNKRILKG